MLSAPSNLLVQISRLGRKLQAHVGPMQRADSDEGYVSMYEDEAIEVITSGGISQPYDFPSERGPGNPALVDPNYYMHNLESARQPPLVGIRCFSFVLAAVTVLATLTLSTILVAIIVLNGVWARLEKLDTLMVCLSSGELDGIFKEIPGGIGAEK